MAFYDVTKCLGIRQHDFAYLKWSWLLMEKNIAARIGRNIAQARKAVRRTQADVAEKLGIDTGSLSRMERGIIMPSIPTLDKIADELGVALWQLIGSASSSSIVMAENIIAQLEKLGQAERLFLMEEIERWVDKLSSCASSSRQDTEE